MTEMSLVWSEFGLVKNAFFSLLAGALVSGMVGPFMFMRRLGFVSAGISHALLGVIGIALLFGLPLLPVLVPATILLGLFMGMLERRSRAGVPEVAVALTWTVGMAIGITALRQVKGYVPDAMSYLFGNAFLLSRSDVLFAWGLSLLALLAVLVFFKGLLACAVDEEFAVSQGLPARGLYYLLLVIVSLAVLSLVRSLGVILMIAMLLVPPAIGEKRSRGVLGMFLWTLGINLFTVCVGLWLALKVDLPVSVAITFVLGALYILL